MEYRPGTTLADPIAEEGRLRAAQSLPCVGQIRRYDRQGWAN